MERTINMADFIKTKTITLKITHINRVTFRLRLFAIGLRLLSLIAPFGVKVVKEKVEN